MKNSFLFGLIVVSLGASMLISLALGRYEIELGTLWQLLVWKVLNLGSAPHDVTLLSNIVFDIRLPRILAVVLVGAALSVSGGAFQAMFVNPLVSPGILGVLAGASFGAALGIMSPTVG